MDDNFILSSIINDNSKSDPTVKKRCKFKGCITNLNQYNVKDQLFCSAHQIKVQLIIDKGYIHQEYEYYKALVDTLNIHVNNGRVMQAKPEKQKRVSKTRKTRRQ